jgi:hypothetical protein
MFLFQKMLWRLITLCHWQTGEQIKTTIYRLSAFLATERKPTQRTRTEGKLNE